MDSILHGGLLRTKDGLKDEDIVVTRELHDIENRYLKKYHPIRELSETYNACKTEAFMFRYTSLKDMIKDCISAYEEQLKEEKKRKSEEIQKGAGAFLEVATETHLIMAEVEPLRKAELIKDIEEKKIKINSLKGKFQILDHSVERMKADYTSSKQHFPKKRYTLMKVLIKRIVRAENLIPESLKT